MNIVHKIGIAIILLVAGFWGSAYLFNHVNPWLGIAAPAVAIIIVAGMIANPIIKRYKQQNEKDRNPRHY